MHPIHTEKYISRVPSIWWQYRHLMTKPNNLHYVKIEQTKLHSYGLLIPAITKNGWTSKSSSTKEPSHSHCKTFFHFSCRWNDQLNLSSYWRVDQILALNYHKLTFSSFWPLRCQTYHLDVINLTFFIHNHNAVCYSYTENP